MPKHALAQMRPTFRQQAKTPLVRCETISPAAIEKRLRANMHRSPIDGHRIGIQSGDRRRPLILWNGKSRFPRIDRASGHQKPRFGSDCPQLGGIMGRVRESAVQAKPDQDEDRDGNAQAAAQSNVSLALHGMKLIITLPVRKREENFYAASSRTRGAAYSIRAPGSASTSVTRPG